jgi:hypothetical protein
VVIGTDCIGSCKSSDHDHKDPLRTTELNIVELDTYMYGNYRDRTLHNKKIYTLFGILIWEKENMFQK